jgi:tRNA-guanine family transglycosylase
MSKEPLGGALNSIHNLYAYLDTMQSVRDAISLGALDDLVARTRGRARQHDVS